MSGMTQCRRCHKDSPCDNSCTAFFSVALRRAFETYWLPRSESIIKGKSVFLAAFALLMVSITVDTSMVSASVQAMIFLANKSITQFRYTKPKAILCPYVSDIGAPDSV